MPRNEPVTGGNRIIFKEKFDIEICNNQMLDTTQKHAQFVSLI